MPIRFIGLYKARKNGPLAQRIASEIVVDGAIDKLSWPVRLAKLWIGLGILVSTLAAIIFLTIGHFSHWTLAIPVLPLGGLIYGIVRIWRRLDRGVERVSKLVRTEIGERAESLQLPKAKRNSPEA